MGLGRRGCRFGALRTASECFRRQRDAMRWRAEPGCTRFFDFAAFSIFPLGDSARRTLRKTDLNKAMHQSRESSRFRSLKASVFRFVRDFFALGAELPRERTGSPLYVGMQTAKAHAETLRRGGKRTACAMIAIRKRTPQPVVRFSARYRFVV